MSYVSASGPNRIDLLPAGTTGTSQPVVTRGFVYLTLYLTASAALSAGTLIVEEASWDDTSQQPYGGTWSQVTSYTLSSVFASSGGQSGQHVPVTNYAHVRVRIGTTVEGGTLAVALELS